MSSARMSRLVMLLASVTLIVALVIPAPAQVREGKKIALLIGVQRYGDDTGLRNLDYTEKDVTDLAAVLRELGYKVTVLTRSEAVKQDRDFLRPTAKNIRAQLEAIAADRKPEDTVLVAFTGHGAHLKSTDKLYFCPAETDLKDEKSLMVIDDVMAALDAKNCKAGAKILLMDACRNDPADGATGGNPNELKSATRPLVPDPPGGTVALFSCSKGQISHESPVHKRGYLFHHVIEGLGGKAANKKGEVTWTGLTNYVVDELPDTVMKEKGPKVKQTPEVKGEARAMLLAKYEGGGTGRIERMPTGRDDISNDNLPAGKVVKFAIANNVQMEFCWIPPTRGTVMLGAPREKKNVPPDEPEHVFETPGFWMGKYEVTQEEWETVMGKNPSYFQPGGEGKEQLKKDNILDTKRFPVEHVSWDDCQKFIEQINEHRGVAKVFGRAGQFALPHEDQWEYACRGGADFNQAFYWGDKLDSTQANCRAGFSFEKDKGPTLGRTCPVDFTNGGKYERHPWNLHHMHGNVMEWCENKYEQTDKRVYRGSHSNSIAAQIRVSERHKAPPAYRGYGGEYGSYVGFRLVLLPDRP